MVNQVVYTNSNVSDIWEMFYFENKKHSNSNLFFISNEKPDFINNNYFFKYDNDEPYYLVWKNALEYFNLNTFIYLQEDLILYDNVNEKEIDRCEKFLINSDYSFIRLIKSENLGNVKIEEDLYYVEHSNPNIFSMQPTIWKTSEYIKLMDNVRSKVWYDEYNYHTIMNKLKMDGLYYYNGENKRGKNHYDSSIYPYIATAIVKGKWNIKEYEKELNKLFKKYNINLKEKGCNI